VFIDTPGLHARGDKGMSHYLNRTAHSASLQDVDVVVFVVQALVWTDEDERALNALRQSWLPRSSSRSTRSTWSSRTRHACCRSSRHGRVFDFAELVPVSAREGRQPAERWPRP
jgi:GTPase